MTRASTVRAAVRSTLAPRRSLPTSPRRDRGTATSSTCITSDSRPSIYQTKVSTTPSYRSGGDRLVQILDLLAEDDRLNVYAGELEVRPPCAPTTEPHEE